MGRPRAVPCSSLKMPLVCCCDCQSICVSFKVQLYISDTWKTHVQQNNIQSALHMCVIQDRGRIQHSRIVQTLVPICSKATAPQSTQAYCNGRHSRKPGRAPVLATEVLQTSDTKLWDTTTLTAEHSKYNACVTSVNTC